MSYRVNAEWDDTGWWVVTVPDVPGAITQCRRLDQVPADAAEVIEIQTGQPVEPENLDVHAHLPGEAGEAAGRDQKLRAEFQALKERAEERTRAAVIILPSACASSALCRACRHRSEWSPAQVQDPRSDCR